MRFRSLITALAITMAATGAAQAQDQTPPADPAATPPATPPATTNAAGGGLGQVGQIALLIAMDGSSINLANSDVSFIHTSSSMGGGSANLFSLSPTAHYFVAPNISVSGGLIVQTGSTSIDTGLGSVSVDATAIGINAGAGYNLPLTPMLSLWPQLQIGYVHTSASAGGNSASGYTIPLQVLVPLLWHPAEHFFLGIGGVFRTELASKMESMDQAKQTDVGLNALIGGYFNL